MDGSFSNDIILEILSKICDTIIKTNKKFIININSTVQPGSIEGEIIPFIETRGLKNNEDFYILYNPYFVALGSVIRNLQEPDYFLIGSSSIYAAKKITKFYNYNEKSKYKSAYKRHNDEDDKKQFKKIMNYYGDLKLKHKICVKSANI